MGSHYCHHNYSDSELTKSDRFNPALAIADSVDENRLMQTQIRLEIPKNFHQESVISRLISEHRIAVNVTDAPIGTNSRCDRWFTLELRGKVKQIRSALTYLNEIHPNVLHNTYPQGVNVRGRAG